MIFSYKLSLGMTSEVLKIIPWIYLVLPQLSFTFFPKKSRLAMGVCIGKFELRFDKILSIIKIHIIVAVILAVKLLLQDSYLAGEFWITSTA